MIIHPIADYPVIEIHGFKWPKRPTSVAMGYLIGEDIFGKWVGIAEGNPWRDADGSRSGVFELSFVKLFPTNTFWTACFGNGDIVIDVDISLPVTWVDHVVEEVDLELDVLCTVDWHIYARDQEKLIQVHEMFSMPTSISDQAERTCQDIQQQIEQRVEPFSEVGFTWLRQFLSALDAARD
jgi:protein associated with RNAse G/E